MHEYVLLLCAIAIQQNYNFQHSINICQREGKVVHKLFAYGLHSMSSIGRHCQYVNRLYYLICSGIIKLMMTYSDIICMRNGIKLLCIVGQVNSFRIMDTTCQRWLCNNVISIDITEANDTGSGPMISLFISSLFLTNL